MSFHKNLITLSIFAVITPSAFAQQEEATVAVQTLETIQVQAHP